MTTTNLYDEDGIEIYLTLDGDICDAGDPLAARHVIGHSIYAVSLDEAKQSIRKAYRVSRGELGW